MNTIAAKNIFTSRTGGHSCRGERLIDTLIPAGRSRRLPRAACLRPVGS
ncbi:MAG: hypothetical protein QHH75_05825 [Bacillota bacterium]|nr:hypothetical protein [Bacillota bacterium]